MMRNLFSCAAVGLLLSSLGSMMDIHSNGFRSPGSDVYRYQTTVAPLEQEGLMDTNMELQQDKPRYILIEVVPDLMKYSTDTFTVTAGEKIVLELDNLDGMQHNLVIAKPGSLQKVGAAADAMLTDPKASEKNYVPEIPAVLFSTPLVDPGDLYSLEFTVPKEPGLYPFVCTFPGHWRMMSGIMQVEKKS